MTRRSWRWAIHAVVTAIAGVLAASSPALADATNGRNAVHFNLTCDGQEVVMVVSPSEPSAAAQIAGSTATLVAGDITLTTTFTDPATGDPVVDVEHFVFGAAHGQANGFQTVNCVETVTVDDPPVGLITIVFDGNLMLTPPR